ncbi:hypothetical protein M4I32_04535 [Microbacterium sp. LRZ72]|uniref:hypothetical protein n=1 Tax=Microbacterium sp. LRZ72 TaxID=2942481 RepID=UPI0029AEE485|nr:hypothetical protein [Microbacterium sp. LRZ72]MDX2376064.1 hypothetical protein [Microbacterium sp. LRZ72]
MGVRTLLARAASARAAVLIAEAPGAWVLRARTESAIAARGWRLAHSPADADVLLTCGTAGPQLIALADRIRDQLPGPRERCTVTTAAQIIGVLDAAQAGLADDDRQRRGARERQDPGDGNAHDDDSGEYEHEHAAEHDADGDGDDGHSDHEGEGGHEGHGSHEMAPSGIPLAEGEPDIRDGLEMDALRLRLGPVLPCWPAGLTLVATLHGDTVARAEAEVIDRLAAPDPAHAGARSCDLAAGLLSLAGADAAAARLRRIRDRMLRGAEADANGDTGRDADAARDALLRERVRLRRAPLLRWSLRGAAPLDAAQARRLGLPAHHAGDAWDRLHALLADAAEPVPPAAPASDDPLPALCEAVTGRDLATARLLVAGLDLAHAAAERRAHA